MMITGRLGVKRRRAKRSSTSTKPTAKTAMIRAGRAHKAAIIKAPKLAEKLRAISTDSEMLTRPPTYSMANYKYDLYRLAWNAKKKKKLQGLAALAAAISFVKVKKGADLFFVLVKATSEFDTKPANKISTKLKLAFAKNLTLAEFASTLRGLKRVKLIED